MSFSPPTSTSVPIHFLKTKNRTRIQHPSGATPTDLSYRECLSPSASPPPRATRYGTSSFPSFKCPHRVERIGVLGDGGKYTVWSAPRSKKNATSM
ncbi:hypothetical protein EDB85DRAFT_2018435 [Lactarius pseudohatsudake]|nr:hypothetical protein EDB85DRAFT_2018435 [Lactarius pseudohatsudake]